MQPVHPALFDEAEAKTVTFAKDQPEYRPLDAQIVKDQNGYTTVVTRWTLTAEERQAIAEGADFYLAVLTFGRPLQPLYPTIGSEQMLAYLRPPEG